MFGDVQLHVEWQEPADISGSSQNRGNSGVFLMGLFEIQVLDSYRARTYADGQAGAMYGQWPPLVNAARPPGQWQSYDIVFEAPQFSGDQLKRPASMTVFLNGVLLHNHKAETGPTLHRRIPKYVAAPSQGPSSCRITRSLFATGIWLAACSHHDQPEKMASAAMEDARRLRHHLSCLGFHLLPAIRVGVPEVLPFLLAALRFLVVGCGYVRLGDGSRLWLPARREWASDFVVSLLRLAF